MHGERLQNDEMATMGFRVNRRIFEAFEEVARREKAQHINEPIRAALGTFLVQYSEVHPTFNDFLHSHDIDLSSLVGQTALDYLELFQGPEDQSSQK